MNLELETLTNNLKELSLSQLTQTKKFIDGIIKKKSFDYSIDSDGMPNCPHCNSSIIKKNGKTRNKTQRYLCLNNKCNKSFSSNTKTFMERSKKFHDYIYEMIEYTLDGLTIRNISTKLSIPITTVWTWRTKILLMLEDLIDEKNCLSNIIYSDETYLKISLKGTKKHNMPRKSYKSKRPSVAHRELVCIQTVIDDTKRPVFKINGTARLTKEKLDDFLLPLIKDGATLVSDGEPSYIGFRDENYITHERILNYKEKSKNGYSLAPINSLHSSFKFMISKYRGVSTKRLKGYINLFILKFVLKQALTEKEIIEYVYESFLDLDYNITDRYVESIPFPINVHKIYEELRKEGLFN